jgi:general stress protein 26
VTEDALRRALLAELAVVQAGLLGIIGAGGHPRPMYHLFAGEGAGIWFLAPAHGDLLASVGRGAAARFCLTGHRHDLFASLTGPIRPVPDRQGLESVWSPMAEALFPGGPGDPDRMPLHLTPTEAAIWTAPHSAVVTGMALVLSGLAGQGDRAAAHAILPL